MQEEEGDRALEPGAAVAQAADSASILDKIKRRRDERDDEVDIPIPSWDDELLARYRVIDRAEIDRMVRSIRIRQARNGNGKGRGQAPVADSEPDANFLIKACIGVIAVDLDTGTEEQVATGLNMELAARLGDPDPDAIGTFLIKSEAGEVLYRISTPQELVAYLVKGNTISLAAHAQKVARWMQDTSKSVEDPS